MPGAAQHLPTANNLDKGIDLHITECTSCGLVQTLNEPVPYFREVIRSAGISEEMKEFRRVQFRDFIDRYALRAKNVIEIGCGKGEYLSIINELGVLGRGIEYGAEAVIASQRKGLNVCQMYLDHNNDVIPGGPFDAFLFLNFLEHLPQPREMLQLIRENLSDSGVGLIEVPNFDMILEEELFTEFITDHVSYFTKETLETSLSISGFEVIECEETWHRYTISAVVKKRKTILSGEMCATVQSLRRSINELISKYPSGEVAIWGAGHQAFTVMSMSELGGKVKCVVDSAPFKQGCVTPATHIPIISPDSYFSSPSELIIIMAGSYSNEVAEIVEKKLSGDVDVAILEGQKVRLL